MTRIVLFLSMLVSTCKRLEVRVQRSLVYLPFQAQLSGWESMTGQAAHPYNQKHYYIRPVIRLWASD